MILPVGASSFHEIIITKSSYTDQVIIGVDMAASEFFRSGKYNLNSKSPMTSASTSHLNSWLTYIRSSSGSIQ
ncbi:rCG61247 [Rattus norvegicus]|uniref:phosphopyruvate hydratase n=1 Tax=Rattus norvegicus TaxID=10116 RepID=A6KEI5_RAT|nr:rCG61247 [Rattus norvegicus]